MEKQKNVPELRFPAYTGEWEKKKLGVVTTWSSGGTPSKDNPLYWDGDIPWISASSMRGITYSDSVLRITKEGLINGSKIAQKGSLLLLVRGSMLFKTIPIGITTRDVAFNQDVKSIDVKLYNDTMFILYWFISSESIILNKVTGTGIGAGKLDLLDLKKLSILLPTLPEQTRIASFLTSIDQKISQLKQKKYLLEQYKKGIMQKLFSQELRFKDENGEEYPNWGKKKLIEIAKFRRGSFPQPYGLEKWYDELNGSPFIQVFDVDDNFKLKATTKSKISDLAKPFSVFVEKGTILLTIQGSIGRIANTQYDSYVDRTLLIFQSYRVSIDKCFFMYSVYLLFQIEKEKAPGGTIKTITKEVLSDFIINLPCLAEQTKIANFLSAIDNKINHTQTQIQQTEQYKKGLLQQMFC